VRQAYSLEKRLWHSHLTPLGPIDSSTRRSPPAAAADELGLPPPSLVYHLHPPPREHQYRKRGVAPHGNRL